jgi:hypothetical protein
MRAPEKDLSFGASLDLKTGKITKIE